MEPLAFCSLIEEAIQEIAAGGDSPLLLDMMEAGPDDRANATLCAAWSHTGGRGSYIPAPDPAMVALCF